MSKKWKWTLAVLGVLLVAVFIGLSVMAGSPKDAYGMVRYALPHMHRSKLHPGDAAPDAQVLALDGKQRFHLRERMQQRPLVLVFGSYT
jgi:Iodothyronine deiodinase